MHTARSSLSRNRQRGVTLVETSLAIVAILVLIGIASTYWTTSQERLRQARVVNAVSAIDSAVHAQYQSVFVYTGISLSVLWPSLPGDVRGPGAASNTINTPYGTTISLAPQTNGAGTNTRYAITLSSLPTPACNALLNAVSANFQTINTDGTNRKALSNTPLTPAAVSTACAGAGGNDPASIVLVNG